SEAGRQGKPAASVPYRKGLAAAPKGRTPTTEPISKGTGTPPYRPEWLTLPWDGTRPRFGLPEKGTRPSRFRHSRSTREERSPMRPRRRHTDAAVPTNAGWLARSAESHRRRRWSARPK